MARKKKDKVEGFDADKVPDYAKRIEAVQSEIDSITAQAQKDCEPHRQDIAAIKKEARENDNIPARAFNSILQKRRLLNQVEAIRANLSEPQQDDFDRMETALGMGELGRAAIRRELTEQERATAH